MSLCKHCKVKERLNSALTSYADMKGGYFTYPNKCRANWVPSMRATGVRGILFVTSPMPQMLSTLTLLLYSSTCSICRQRCLSNCCNNNVCQGCSGLLIQCCCQIAKHTLRKSWPGTCVMRYVPAADQCLGVVPAFSARAGTMAARKCRHNSVNGKCSPRDRPCHSALHQPLPSQCPLSLVFFQLQKGPEYAPRLCMLLSDCEQPGSCNAPPSQQSGRRLNYWRQYLRCPTSSTPSMLNESPSLS